jgi:hypothetical protein
MAGVGGGGNSTYTVGPIYVQGNVDSGNVRELAKKIVSELRFMRK